MSCYAVVKVYHTYELIEDVTCISVHATRQDAEFEVQKIKTDRAKAWSKRINYISEFVDNLEIPKGLNYHEWLDFCKNNFDFLYNPRPSEIKEKIKGYFNTYGSIRDHKGTILEGFNPPEYDFSGDDYFVVEIKKK